MVQSGSVRIWWDEDCSAYRMITPYNKEFVDLLHNLIPFSDRVFDKESKTWTVTERFMPPLVALVEKAYGTKPIIVTKEQAQRASASSPQVAKSDPLDTTIVKFFRLLPFEAAQKAYKQAALQLHPDRNPGSSLEAMTSLNAAWQRLEKELYKRG